MPSRKSITENFGKPMYPDDPRWVRENDAVVGFMFTDLYTGETRFITPADYPDRYPFGYFGSSISARWHNLPPDERIDSLRIGINHIQNLDYNPSEEERRKQQIDRWQAHIAQLQDPAHRVAEARRILAHRKSFLDKLTPRDRAIADIENIEYERWIAESAPH